MLGVVLGLLDPKSMIESASPFGELLVMGIIFAETGLLIGFFFTYILAGNIQHSKTFMRKVAKPIFVNKLLNRLWCICPARSASSCLA